MYKLVKLFVLILLWSLDTHRRHKLSQLMKIFTFTL